MASWEPVDIDPIDCDRLAEDDDKWNDDVMNDLERRFEELRRFNENLNESRDKDTREEMLIFIDATRHDIEELVANQTYDKLTTSFNNTRKNLVYRKVADDGALSYIYKRTVIDLGNISERLKPP